MTLNTKDATYNVVIESQIPIDCIVFQSELGLEMLEMENGAVN
jgi:hypothetical protein